MSGGYKMDNGFINTLNRNYSAIFNFTGGLDSQEAVMSIALQYTMANKMYNGLQQEEMMKKINAGRRFASVVNSYSKERILLEKVAAKIVAQGEVDSAIKELHLKQELLVANGFKNDYYCLLAASYLQDELHAQRAITFYEEMKKQQRFLTRRSDYPIAVLLTRNGEANLKAHVQTIYQYYNALKEQGFKMGDELQTLAQILTFYKVSYVDAIPQYVAHLRKELEIRNMKIRKNLYPSLGLLAITGADTQRVEQVVLLQEELSKTKNLKYISHMAFVIAVQKVLHDYKEVNESLTTSQSFDWMDLFIYSDLLFALPKVLLESLLPIDLNFFN